MTRKTEFAFVGLLLVGGLWFGKWFLAAPAAEAEAPPPVYIVLARDISPSVPKNCDALTTMVDKTIADLIVGKDSRFAMIWTGDGTSSFEPVLGLDTALPRPGRRGAIRSGKGQTEKKFRAELAAACARVKPTNTSPIYRGIEIGLEHLQSLGCSSGAVCKMVVETDLEETVHSGVIKALSGKAKPGDVPKLRNDGIKVLV
jgi:hypothetical protein